MGKGGWGDCDLLQGLSGSPSVPRGWMWVALSTTHSP